MHDALFHPFLHAAHLLEELLRKRLAQYDLQPRQARVIDAIARSQPISQVVLARMFDVSPASMSVMLARMEKAGLIERSPELADARFFQVALSQHGQAMIDIITREWAAVDQEIEATIGRHDARELHRVSLRLRNGLGGKAPDEADEQRETPRLFSTTGSLAVYIAFDPALGYIEQPPGAGQRILTDVHGAGAQRSDPKTGDPTDFPFGFGPQGDDIRIHNFSLCVSSWNQHH